MYARPGQDLYGQAREDAIIEAARALIDLDIDLLELDILVHRRPPPAGAILGLPGRSGPPAVPFEQFTDIIRIAAEEGGASGFIAGRSVWREVVSLAGHQRQEFLTSVALPRLESLITVAERSARPWTGISPAAASPAGADGRRRRPLGGIAGGLAGLSVTGSELGPRRLPSLAKMCPRWVCTVRREIYRRPPICGLDRRATANQIRAWEGRT